MFRRCVPGVVGLGGVGKLSGREHRSPRAELSMPDRREEMTPTLALSFPHA